MRFTSTRLNRLFLQDSGASYRHIELLTNQTGKLRITLLAVLTQWPHETERIFTSLHDYGRRIEIIEKRSQLSYVDFVEIYNAAINNDNDSTNEFSRDQFKLTNGVIGNLYRNKG